MRIDAHQHFWKLGRGDYGWITPELPVLYRDFLPGDLKPELEKHGIERTILVQAAQTADETDFMLRLADDDDTIAGVVGWLDPLDPGWREQFERQRRHPKYLGLRVMIQEMADASRILEPAFVSAMKMMADEDVPVDLLLRSPQLDPLVRMLEQVPGLRGVIDHIAKPQIAAGVFQPWAEQLKAIAAYPRLYCKLSGMVTEMDTASMNTEDLIPYVRHIIDCFGRERILFGSDWPVCLLAADYGQVIDALQRALPDDWSQADQAGLFGLNAAAFYKLNHN